jgi:GDP-L-fucose synthase
MKKIVVTGAAGFVGRHIVRHLLDEGHQVHAVDSIVPLTGAIDPEAGWPLFDPRDYRQFRFYREDCRDWFNRIRDTDFDYAYHLAAMVGGREMIERNPLAVAADLSIDAAYWQWAKAVQPKKTVCFSSSAAYPIDLQREHGHRLLKEDMISFEHDIGMPDMSYGWAKLTCEYLAQLAYQKHGLRSIVYRPFSGYGEDQDDAYPFPSICKRALQSRGEPALTVWGSGRQMRDFIHIDDCVRAVAVTVDQIDDGGAVNLATGVLTSFIEFARLAANAVGYAPDVTGLSSQPEGVFARGGDTAKLESLGFVHSIKFADGIKAALEYYLRTQN